MPDQEVEHLALAGGAHRVDQRLVAVAQVGGQPARRFGDGPAGPGAVGQVERLERRVTMTGHAARPRLDGVGPDGPLPYGRCGYRLLAGRRRLLRNHDGCCSSSRLRRIWPGPGRDLASGHANTPRRGSGPYRPSPRLLRRSSSRSMMNQPYQPNGTPVVLSPRLGWARPRAGTGRAAGGSVVEAQAAELLGVALPVLGHLDVQVEVDAGAQERLDLLAGAACRRPQPLAAWCR